MSNPAVTQLCKTVISGTNFWMDDNIGESIHVHIGDVRIDLTDIELNELCSVLCSTINKIVNVSGFDCHKINPVYLQDMLWRDLIHLTKVELDWVPLKKLICPYYGKFIELPKSRAVKALNGDQRQNDDTRRSHHIGQSSQERLDSIFNSIKRNNYPYQGEYIILYGNDYIIQDGQHRAACLWFLYGDIEVPVLRLFFDNYIDFDKRGFFKRSRYYYIFTNILSKFRRNRNILVIIISKLNSFFYNFIKKYRKHCYLKKHIKQHNELLDIISFK